MPAETMQPDATMPPAGMGQLDGLVMALGPERAGAPHQRQRLFWVAHATSERGRWRQEVARPPSKKPGGSGAHLCADAWPAGYGSGSPIPVGDVCSASYGIPGLVGRLRAYGNAIVPQVAAVFVMANG